MQQYLASSQALDSLCQRYRGNPRYHGLRNTVKGGAALLFGAASIAVGLFDVSPNIELPVDTVEKIGGPIVGAGCIVYSIYKLPDGIVSLLKPYMSIASGEELYFHNGGYTNRATWADRKYGERVHPIDNAGDLEDLEGLVFINGLKVKETELTKENETEPIAIMDVPMDVPENNTPGDTFKLVLQCKFQGAPINVSTELQDYDSIRELYFAPIPYALDNPKEAHLIGNLKKSDNGKKELDLIKFGEAFAARQ